MECFQAAEYGDTEAAQPEVTDLSEAEEGDCHDTDTDSLTFEPESNLTTTTVSTPHHFPDQVLDCLSQLAGLYGDSLMVVQFLPHCWDLVSRARGSPPLSLTPRSVSSWTPSS